jgi:hypothetical protein
MLRSAHVLRSSSRTLVRPSAASSASASSARHLHYVRHTPLSVRAAIRPSSRGSHHPTNLPQIFPRGPSPVRVRRNSSSATGSGSRGPQQPSRRMRFVRRFIETVPAQHTAISKLVFSVLNMDLGGTLRHRLWNILLRRPVTAAVHRHRNKSTGQHATSNPRGRRLYKPLCPAQKSPPTPHPRRMHRQAPLKRRVLSCHSRQRRLALRYQLPRVQRPH